MPHVQRAGHIRRRQQDAEVVGFGGIQASGKIAARLPDGIPAFFDFSGFKALGKFNGQAAGEKTPILADARRMTGMFSLVDGFRLACLKLGCLNFGV